jgi:hypothetical protein
MLMHGQELSGLALNVGRAQQPLQITFLQLACYFWTQYSLPKWRWPSKLPLLRFDSFEITAGNSVNVRHLPDALHLWRNNRFASNAIDVPPFGLRQTVQSTVLPICSRNQPFGVKTAQNDGTTGLLVLAGFLVLCLVLRTIMAYRIPGLCPDAVLYIGLGKAIEMGQYQQALGQIRFNIYPFVLSTLHHCGLSWETAGLTWGVVISSCTVLPLYGWIRRAFDRRVAIAACILYSIHSELIRWSVEVIRDSTFWFLFVLSLYLLWRAVTELRWLWYLAAGAAIALACLTRFEGLVLFVPLTGWSWWRRQEAVNCRGRLIAAGLVCASIYPFSLMLASALWFHGRTTDLVGTRPVMLAEDWAQESITGQRSMEKLRRPDVLAPLPVVKMAERFVTGMVKGITPLYLLAVAVGIATSWRRDYRALACAAALILAAIWVHLYWSHEAGPRYFFPIVLMAAPLAGRGLLQISAALANRAGRQYSASTALLAAAAPLTIVLVVNLSVAWGSDVRARAATVDLGHWVQSHYGPATRVLGPDGITQVVNHYAQGRCQSFPQTATATVVVRQMTRFRPEVVLLSTDCHALPSDKLSTYLASMGYKTVDRSSLPKGCEMVLVLVRPTDGNGKENNPRS